MGKKSRLIIAVISVLLAGIGAYLLAHVAGWEAVVGVVLLLWSDNLSQKLQGKNPAKD
jgi:hypothetical protein